MDHGGITATAMLNFSMRRSGRIKEPDWPSSIGYVYFIQSGPSDGLVKIGWTRKPRSRLMSLRVGNPEPLSMLAAVPGTRVMEKRMHKSLALHRRSGEWFVTHPDVHLAMLEACEAAEHILTMDSRDQWPTIRTAPAMPLRPMLTTKEAMDLAIQRVVREYRAKGLA